MPCYNNIIKNTRDTKHYEQMIPNQMINKLKDCDVHFMKAVIPIDSFKGSLSSFEAGNSAAEGIRRVYPDAQIEVRPLADGGEGTVDSTRTAIIEMSGAAGITLVPDTERNPLYTTTYGVGEVIRDAITKGCRHFIVGIGGSATNDGGAGMLQALGFGLLDKNGNPVPFGAMGLEVLDKITTDNVLPELKDCTFRIACDVTNTLCGEQGCSAIFGPQKGATPAMILQMDKWLAYYATLAREIFPHANPKAAGSGAAGGLGFAFMTFLNGTLESGIKIVLEETRLSDYIKDADIVVTGEGRLDGQTVMGKAPIGVAKIAKQFDKPVLAFSGCVTKDATACNREGIGAFFPVLRNVVSLEDAMNPANARQNMADTAEQVLRTIRTFSSL